jgi:mannose/fructose/N-acetylgalactosamine-specific phosphotransferase system component IIC
VSGRSNAGTRGPVRLDCDRLGYIVLGLVAGLAAVERKGFLQAMLSRPIALAPVTGWALGDVAGGVLVAPPLELFWLGAVNLGAAVPVHESLGAAAIAGGAVLAGRALGTGVTPQVAVLAVLLCAPLALVGRKADRLVEGWNERLAARAEAQLEVGHARAAVRANLYGLAMPFAISAVLAPAGAFVAALAIPAALRAAPGAAAPLGIGWLAFAAFAAASGAKALRAKDAPVWFVAAAAAVAVIGLSVGRLAP